MLKTKTIFVFSAIFLCLTFIALVAFWSTDGKICAQGINEKEPNCTTYDVCSYIPFFWLRFLDLYNGLIQGLAAIAVGGFTYWLMVIARNQKDISSAQVEIMNSGLIETVKSANAAVEQSNLLRTDYVSQNPARLKVSKLWCNSFPHGKGAMPSLVQFEAKNVGGSNAIIISTWIVFSDERELHKLALKNIHKRHYASTDILNPSPGMIVKPGQACTFTHSIFDDYFGDGATNENMVKALSTVLVGEVIFQDQNGIPRSKGFCRKFDPHTHRFVAGEYPDYEYED